MKKTFVTSAGILTAVLFCAVFFIRCLDPGNESGTSPSYPQTVNVSYIATPFNLQIMVMKEQGLLENAFASFGVGVRWHVINTGADQARAMAAGSLDIASVINATSVILANVAGNPVHIAALVSRPRETFALMTGPGGPRTVRELKGKTIAGPKGSVLHQMLLAALAKEGMPAADVSIIQMGLPEARTALLAGRVDAALQAGNLIISNEEAGMRTLITADGYITPLLFTAVRPAFAENYPRLLEVYLAVQTETAAWIAANTDEAVAIGARVQQISISDAAKLYNWNGVETIMEDSDVEALTADVDFLYQQNMIEQKINPRQFILPSAFGK